jgi:hypothetical protein
MMTFDRRGISYDVISFIMDGSRHTMIMTPRERSIMESRAENWHKKLEEVSD